MHCFQCWSCCGLWHAWSGADRFAISTRTGSTRSIKSTRPTRYTKSSRPSPPGTPGIRNPLGQAHQGTLHCKHMKHPNYTYPLCTYMTLYICIAHATQLCKLADRLQSMRICVYVHRNHALSVPPQSMHGFWQPGNLHK